MFKNAPTVNISGLCFDSRKVKPGDLYFCLPGLTYDGHNFIDQAIDRGAVGIVHSKSIENPMPGAIYIRVDDVNEAMNQAAKIFYNRPAEKLMMFGITGTNGKSSVANIIRWFEQEDRPCGYIGTIAIAYGNVNLTPDLTTPDALLLQSTLRDMADAKMQACALEVSSHGLALGRVNGIDFDVAVFTNFTYDHLDFHGTLENYFNAKALLFSQRVKKDGVSVLNVDDPKFEELKNASRARTVTYGVKREADYRGINVEINQDNIQFDLVYKGQIYHIKSNLVGEFNVYNLLASLAACHETGSDLLKLIELSKSIPQIAGRMEQIEEGQGYHVIVDFAHTPDGMEKMMEFGRSITANGRKLISVFGSAGKRDKAKRKVFGQLADQYCDVIYLTEDDPRDEDPKEIADEIRKGIHEASVSFIPERYEAIRQAIESARDGDTVLILGKGDEPYMYSATGRTPWMGDNKAAIECIHRTMKEH